MSWLSRPFGRGEPGAARPGDSDDGQDATRAPDQGDGEATRESDAGGPSEADDRTGLAGAPDPRRDHEALAAARDRAAYRELLPGRQRDPMGNDAVPRGLQIAAAWAWRLVALAAAVWVILQVIARTQLVLVPVAVALLLAALLQPIAAAMAKRGMPPALASAVVLIGGIAGIALLVSLVVAQFRTGLGDLTGQAEDGIDKIRDWLVNGPLGLSQSQLDSAITSIKNSVRENRSALTTGAIGAAATAGHVAAGLLISLFSTFFLVKDGRRIWSWIVRLFPRDARARADGAGQRAWYTLISYVRATFAVAFVDALGVGLGAALLGVPLALPLGVLVFLGAFVPIVGASVSGLVAVLVALVAKGPAVALILLAIVIAVQQLEGHVLQPLLLGRAVKVHPLAVVLAIATGVLLAGIVGALVAVPIVAVANTVVSYLTPDDHPPPGTPSTGGAPVPTG